MSTREAKGVAAVVGVGAGLGAALARRFAGQYAVALMAREEAKLQQLATEIAATGGRAIAVSVDVSKAEEIHSAFERTRNELGEVDVLLYNAAMRPFGRLMETKPSTFENTWRVNAFGAFLCSREVVPAMLGKGRRSRRLRQRRWRNRHAVHSQAASGFEARGHAQPGCDRRELLARGASGPERLDSGAGSQAVQGKVLGR
jgi:NAD(P)-dependent dehydrogenase (short-subunit alcohol dehydrogenase family)